MKVLCLGSLLLNVALLFVMGNILTHAEAIAHQNAELRSADEELKKSDAAVKASDQKLKESYDALAFENSYQRSLLYQAIPVLEFCNKPAHKPNKRTKKQAPIFRDRNGEPVPLTKPPEIWQYRPPDIQPIPDPVLPPNRRGRP